MLLDRPSSMTRRAVVRWLTDLTANRTLRTVPPNMLGEGRDLEDIVSATQRLLASFSSSFAAYRAIVLDAETFAKQNDVDLARTIERVATERATIARAAATTQAIRATCSEVARHATMLARIATTFRGNLRASLERLQDAADVVGGFDTNLASGAGALIALGTGWGAVGSHVDAVSRTSRNARLLAINAAIEAAYAPDGVTGFTIVAQEMRKLSQATLDAGTSVREILGKTTSSLGDANRATHEARSLTATIVRDLRDAATTLRGQQGALDAFGSAIEEISATADQQTVSVPILAENVEHLNALADAVVTDAQAAALLRLGNAAGPAAAILGAYRDLDAPLSQARTSAERGDPTRDALARWIDAVARGERGYDEGFEGVLASLRRHDDDGLSAAIIGLVERLLRDEREIVRTLMQLSISAARNGAAWAAIVRTMTAVREKAENFATILQEANAATACLAAGFDDVRASLERLGSYAASAITTVEGAMQNVSATAACGEELARGIDAVYVATGRTIGELEKIVDLSSEATLLSLNATIEAAHAGSRGASFSVIADEIGKLAAATQATSETIAREMERLATRSEAVRDGSRASNAQLADVVRAAGASTEGIRALRSSLEAVTLEAAGVARTASGQAENVDGLLGAFASLTSVFGEMATAFSTDRRIELASIGTRAHEVAARRRLGTVAERMRDALLGSVEAIESVCAMAVREGRASAEAFATPSYRRIGSDEPARYETGYDEAIRPAVRAVMDRIARANPQIIALGFFDLNAYAIVLSSSAADRERRILSSLGFRSIRVGLEPAAPLPERATRADFERSATLTRAEPRPAGVSTYAMDTGVVVNQVGVAVYLHDRRFATLTAIYDASLI